MKRLNPLRYASPDRVIVAVLAIVLLLILLDGVLATRETFEARIESLVPLYGASSVGSNYTIMVRTDSELVVPASCEPSLYYRKSKGSVVECTAYIGRLSSMVWIIKAVK